MRPYIRCFLPLTFAGLLWVSDFVGRSVSEAQNTLPDPVQRAVDAAHSALDQAHDQTEDANAIALEAEADCEPTGRPTNPMKLIKEYREALKKEDNPAIWRKLAVVYQVSGLLCEAAEAFEKAGDTAKAEKTRVNGSCR